MAQTHCPSCWQFYDSDTEWADHISPCVACGSRFHPECQCPYKRA